MTSWDQFSNFIGKVGFPVAMACVLLWMFYQFLGKIVENQTRIIELMNQCLRMSK